MIIFIIVVLEIIFSAAVFFFIGLKTFKAWQTYREEFLLHSTFFLIAMSIFIVIYSIYIYPSFFGINVSTNIVIIFVGIFYDLFYLEVSIIYLTIFTNSRTVFESYSPIIIGALAVINLYSEILQSFIYNIILNSIFHALILLMGIFLIIMGIRHLSKSKKYINNKEELEFVDFLIKISSALPIILLSDGIGFLAYEIFAPTIVTLNESFLLIFYALLIIISVVLYYATHLIAKHVKNINLTSFLNTIS